MTREMLYDAITEVRDELIVEAIEVKPAKSKVHWLKFGSIAAAFAVVAGLGAGVVSGKIPWLRIGGSAGGSGHGDNSSTFMSYAGPVFPLTTVRGGDDLTAERTITYDFEGWMAGDFNRLYYSLPVTDSYTLTNPTGEDKTVTLLYPFVGTLTDSKGYDHYPVLTVDGEKADAALRAGGYAGGFGNGIFANQEGSLNLRRPQSWEDYQALLSDGRYQASALEDWPDLSHIPVTVYEITNPWLAEDAEGTSPNIQARFALDYDETTVLTYGFNGAGFDREAGTMMNLFSVLRPHEYTATEILEEERIKPHYIIVIGNSVEDFRLVGAQNGNSEDTVEYLEWSVEIGADLRQYETDLESALRTVFDWSYRNEVWDGQITPDMVFGAMKDCLLRYGLLSDNPADRCFAGMLEELDYAGVDRVLYLETKVTIPAGGSVTVEARMLKEASFDFAGASSRRSTGVYGYDLVTRLGTSLVFTSQTARAMNTRNVEIVRQNYGFDWENGVDTVTLDPAVEHYYMEVRRIKTK